MNLNNLKPAENSVKKSKRVGRGQGTGKGGTATRGHKGAKSRSGSKRRIGFEGGQMPLQRRVPKFGFKNINRVEYKILNLNQIQDFIDRKVLSEKITLENLIEKGIISKNDMFKVLSVGEVKSSVEIEANKISAKAKEIIESKGGKVNIVQA